jgi:rhodanese-related sulfurtransferase
MKFELHRQLVCWIVARLCIGRMLLWPSQVAEVPVACVTPAQAVQLINREKAQVVDVCETASSRRRHIGGAKNIPVAIWKRQGPARNKASRWWWCAPLAAARRAHVAQLKKLGYETPSR